MPSLRSIHKSTAKKHPHCLFNLGHLVHVAEVFVGKAPDFEKCKQSSITRCGAAVLGKGTPGLLCGNLKLSSNSEPNL